MSRQLCGICMCPYDEQDGSCGCTEVNQECNSSQVKELTDEEIEEVIKTFQLNSLMKNLDYKDFAKAILRKAQENETT